VIEELQLHWILVPWTRIILQDSQNCSTDTCKRDGCLIGVLLQNECGETDDVTNDNDNYNDDGDESTDEPKDKLKVEINEDQDNVDIDTDQQSDENDS